MTYYKCCNDYNHHECYVTFLSILFWVCGLCCEHTFMHSCVIITKKLTWFHTTRKTPGTQSLTLQYQHLKCTYLQDRTTRYSYSKLARAIVKVLKNLCGCWLIKVVYHSSSNVYHSTDIYHLPIIYSRVYISGFRAQNQKDYCKISHFSAMSKWLYHAPDSYTSFYERMFCCNTVFYVSEHFVVIWYCKWPEVCDANVSSFHNTCAMNSKYSNFSDFHDTMSFASLSLHPSHTQIKIF